MLLSGVFSINIYSKIIIMMYKGAEEVHTRLEFLGTTKEDWNKYFYITRNGISYDWSIFFESLSVYFISE